MLERACGLGCIVEPTLFIGSLHRWSAVSTVVRSPRMMMRKVLALHSLYRPIELVNSMSRYLLGNEKTR